MTSDADEDLWDSPYSPIFQATAHGDVKKVASLLDADPALVRARLDSGDEPLHVAANDGKFAVAKLLIDRGADLNVVGGDDDSPLRAAARNGHLKIVKLLLARGAELEAADQSGCTALLCAASAFDEEGDAVAHYLLKQGARLDVRSAICLGMTDELRAMLRDHPDTLRRFHRPDELFNDALRRCLEEASRERPIPDQPTSRTRSFLTFLVENGGDINGTNEHGATLLHSVVHVTPECAELLLELGADPNIRNYHGDTPAMIARRSRRPAIVELLKRYGAKETPDDVSKSAQKSLAELFGVNPAVVEEIKRIATKVVEPASTAFVAARCGCAVASPIAPGSWGVRVFLSYNSDSPGAMVWIASATKWNLLKINVFIIPSGDDNKNAAANPDDSNRIADCQFEMYKWDDARIRAWVVEQLNKCLRRLEG